MKGGAAEFSVARGVRSSQLHSGVRGLSDRSARPWRRADRIHSRRLCRQGSDGPWGRRQPRCSALPG